MINYIVLPFAFHLQVKNVSRLFRPIDSNGARQERHGRQHKTNDHGSNLDFVAEREEILSRESRFLREEAARNREEGFRLLREEALRNREERLRSEYVGNVDSGHVPYNTYAPSLQTHHPVPVVFDREMPNYGVERHLSRARSPHEGHIRNPPPSLYDPVPVMSGREVLHYGVERNHVPLVSSGLLVDQPLESYGRVYQRQSLAPREQLLPRNDLIADLHYRFSNPQYDVYQQRIDMDMRQRSAQYGVDQQRMEMDMRQHNPQRLYMDMDTRQHIMDGA